MLGQLVRFPCSRLEKPNAPVTLDFAVVIAAFLPKGTQHLKNRRKWIRGEKKNKADELDLIRAEGEEKKNKQTTERNKHKNLMMRYSLDE